MKTEEYEVAGRGVVVEGRCVVVCAGSSYAAINTMNVFLCSLLHIGGRSAKLFREEKHKSYCPTAIT